MYKYLISIFLFTCLCYSQNDTINKINFIDSLCKKKTPYKTSNIIINKKYNLHNGYSFGTGRSTLSLFCDKKNKENILTKAVYVEHIQYKNGMIEKRTGNFYYINNKLFYIKTTIKQINKNETIQDEFNYSYNELLKIESLKNLLLFDFIPWVNEKDQEILKLYLKK